MDAKYGFYRYATRFVIDKGKGTGPEYKATLLIRCDSDGKKYLYDIMDIKKVGTLHLTSTSQGSHGYHGGQMPPQGTPTDDIISQNNTKSNEVSENNEVSTFSLSAPVEETKELIAVHNMTSSELMKTLDLGGLPMPSIAIIKAKSGHAEYGDVSLVFNVFTPAEIGGLYYRNKTFCGSMLQSVSAISVILLLKVIITHSINKIWIFRYNRANILLLLTLTFSQFYQTPFILHDQIFVHDPPL